MKIWREAAGSAERGPTAAAGMAVIVGAFPRELRASRTVARPATHVEVSLDGHEDEFAVTLAGEGYMRGFEQIEISH